MEPPHKSKLVVLLSFALNVVLTTLSIMSAAQSQIKWKSYLRDLLLFWNGHVTKPLWQLVREPTLTATNWLHIPAEAVEQYGPNYYPIAAAFFIGLNGALFHVTRIHLLALLSSLAVSAFRKPHDIGDLCFQILEPPVTVLMIGLAFIFSPLALFLWIPSLGALYFSLVAISALVSSTFFIVRITLWPALLLISHTTIAAYWYVTDRNSFHKYAIPELRKTSPRSWSRRACMSAVTSNAKRAMLYFPRTAVTAAPALRSKAKWIIRGSRVIWNMLLVQYYSAALIALLFLVFFGINVALLPE
jgi:hypothetical protein